MSFSPLNIIADADLWNVSQLFSPFGKVRCVPGREIKAQDLKNVDVLIIRSVTCVNETLLEDTSVKFILSITAGFDHIDIAYLKTKNIPWFTMAGFNAPPVAHYVLSVLAALWRDHKISSYPRIAIVGVGAVGSQVQTMLQACGLTVFLCDPLRLKAEAKFPHTALSELKDIDVFCFHVPLTTAGENKTYHFIDENFLAKQKTGCVILNASRGEILKTEWIAQFSNRILFCLDVFENEPYIDLSILPHVWLATPHIAGYSVQSKIRGMLMAREMCARYFNFTEKLPEIHFPRETIFLNQPGSWQEVILQLFDPFSISNVFKKMMLRPSSNFDVARKYFSPKTELGFINLSGIDSLDQYSKDILQALGMCL